MKKTKPALLSMIVFLSVFCLSAIFNIPSSFHKPKSDSTITAEAVSTESEAVVEEAEENEIQSFSYKPNTIETGWADPYLATDEVLLDQAETDNIQEDNTTTEEEATTTEDNKATDGSTLMAEATESTEIPTENKVSEDTSTEKASKADIVKSTESKKTEKKAALYANIGISVASSFVNIRESATTDGAILGKLYKDSAAEILSTKGDWYYVKSGNVTGYAKSEFIKTGISDEELIEKYSKLRMVVTVDGLNVREKADTESKKLTVLYQNESYSVLETEGDWIKVDVTDDNVIGYVKTEFADLVVDFMKAVSKEEEQELLQIQAEERAKKETEVKYQDGVSYTEADLKLLACLIHAEAGSQSYEGKLAVANVVLNRVKSPKYADTIKGVIYQSGQFSVAASGSLDKQLASYDNYSSTSQKLSIKAAKAALGGANNIGSRLYFHSYKAAVKKGYDSKSNSVRIDDQLFW